MNKQKTIKTKQVITKRLQKITINKKHKYFAFDVNDKKWGRIYSFIIK